MPSNVGVFAAGVLSGALATGAWLLYRRNVQKNACYASSTVYRDAPVEERRPLPESPLEDEILSEQFTRNVQFFGRNGQKAIIDAFVIVVGLGVSFILTTKFQR